jgi:hypothetical protein
MIGDSTVRALILSQPDLAVRLTQPPLDYERAEQWNGFIPPEVWAGQSNGSPRRDALVELVTEATARGQAAA